MTQVNLFAAVQPATITYTDHLDAAFVAWARGEAQYSTNVSYQRFNTSAELGHFETVHQWATRTMNSVERTAFYARNFWHLRRLRFESIFLQSDAYFYAAMNLGDAGLSKYGPVCAVFLPGWPDCPGVVLPDDSLRRYYDVLTDSVLVNDLLRDARHPVNAADTLIDTLKARGDALVTRPQVCHSEDWYIEVIAESPPLVAKVSAVRMTQSLRQQVLTGVASGSPEGRAQFEVFLRLRRHLDLLGIAFEVIPDA